MRVITGLVGGRKLRTIEGLEVRPTSEKVKGSIFNSIQFEIEGATVLDLFCGSGQMGIEALSRSARFCVFVDSSRDSQETTKENLVTTGLFKQSRVVAMDFISYLSSTKDSFDIAFLDPPYSQGLATQALELLVSKMNDGGVIFAEHDTKDDMPDEVGAFKLKKRYKYGRISVSAYRKL